MIYARVKYKGEQFIETKIVTLLANTIVHLVDLKSEFATSSPNPPPILEKTNKQKTKKLEKVSQTKNGISYPCSHESSLSSKLKAAAQGRGPR